MIKKNSPKTFQDFIKTTFKTNEKLPFVTTKVFYPANSIVICPGMIEKNIYFISSGLIQISLTIKKGDEKIALFAYSGQLFNLLSSFITQKPTEFTVTCLTDCTLEYITYEDVQKSLKKSNLATKIYVYHLENSFSTRVKKEKDSLTKEAEERYLELLEEQPELIKQLKIKQIAKYLGIHPYSLSRIRKKFADNKIEF